MANTDVKQNRKFFILATLGLLIPVFILTMAFFAAKSDAETKKKYDKIRLDFEVKMEAKKQQEQRQLKSEQSNSIVHTSNDSANRKVAE